MVRYSENEGIIEAYVFISEDPVFFAYISSLYIPLLASFAVVATVVGVRAFAAWPVRHRRGLAIRRIKTLPRLAVRFSAVSASAHADCVFWSESGVWDTTLALLLDRGLLSCLVSSSQVSGLLSPLESFSALFTKFTTASGLGVGRASPRRALRGVAVLFFVWGLVAPVLCLFVLALL